METGRLMRRPPGFCTPLLKPIPGNGTMPKMTPLHSHYGVMDMHVVISINSVHMHDGMATDPFTIDKMRTAPAAPPRLMDEAGPTPPGHKGLTPA